MSKRKSNEERIQELELKMKQLQYQKKALQRREQEKKRKERTKRLIENGALSEKYFNCQEISPAEFEKLLKRIVSLDSVKNVLTVRNNQE